FPGLFVAPFVSLCTLVIGEQSYRLFGNVRVVSEHLKRGDDAIASEKRGIPWNARGIVIRCSQTAAQHCQITQRSVENLVEEWIVGANTRCFARRCSVTLKRKITDLVGFGN